MPVRKWRALFPAGSYAHLNHGEPRKAVAAPYAAADTADGAVTRAGRTEKAAALADKDKLERELDKAKTAAKKLSGERAAAPSAISRLHRGAESIKARLAETEARLAQAQTSLQATSQTLAQTESAKKGIESQLKGVQQALGVCRTHNGRLYTLSREMMAEYRDKTCQDALAQAEPFTGPRRVEVENLL